MKWTNFRRSLGLLMIGIGAMQPWAHLEAQIRFADISRQAGINANSSNHGVSIIDVDGDGWEDVYVACRHHPNRLYQNQGNGTFVEIASAVGLDYRGDCRLGIWGDVNNDGLLDLFLGTESSGDVLYFQSADGTFQDVSLSAGMQVETGATLGAMFGDIDQDGWLDLYCTRHYRQNTLYRNKGDGTFEDITLEAGATDTTAAMGAVFFDYDHDLDLDIYLVHDAKFPNKLYQNDGHGHFTNVAPEAGVDYAGFGMGVDVADINHDGYLDLYLTNFFENTLFLNNGDGSFTDITTSAGVADIGMGWGVTFFDADNDGWVDIYLNNSKVANNLFPTYPNVLYLNQRDNTFQKVSEGTDLASMDNAYGLASGDLDKDGKVDLMVANFQGDKGGQLFRNESQTDNHWISLALKGRTSNRSAIGTRVALKAGGTWHYDQVMAGTGWASQNSLCLHFGLAQASSIDSLLIHWPSQTLDVYEHIPVDQFLSIHESVQLPSTQASLLIYPNPVGPARELTLKQASPGADIRILDLNGQELPLTKVSYHPFQQDMTVDLSLISPGMYLLMVDGISYPIVLY